MNSIRNVSNDRIQRGEYCFSPWILLSLIISTGIDLPGIYFIKGLTRIRKFQSLKPTRLQSKDQTHIKGRRAPRSYTDVQAVRRPAAAGRSKAVTFTMGTTMPNAGRFSTKRALLET